MNTINKNNVKPIGDYSPDEIRRYALRWFDTHHYENPVYPFITKMLMRVGVAKEMNINAPAAVTIYHSDKGTPRVRLHISPSKLQELSPQSGVEIAPWCIGHEMAHIVHDHLKYKAKDIPQILNESDIVVNDTILTYAQECVCSDMFESLGLTPPLNDKGKNPLIMGQTTPGLGFNTFPLDTFNLYKIISTKYKEWKNKQNQEGNHSLDEDNSQDNTSRDSNSSHSSKDDSNSSHSSNTINDLNDMSIYDYDAKGHCHGVIFVDSEGNPIDGDAQDNSGSQSDQGEQDIPDNIKDAIKNALDAIIKDSEKQEFNNTIGRPSSNGKDDSNDNKNRQEEDDSLEQDSIPAVSSSNVDSSFRPNARTSKKERVVHIDEDIVSSYDWQGIVSDIVPPILASNGDYGESFNTKHDWSRQNMRMASIYRHTGSVSPAKRLVQGNREQSVDVSIFLDLSGSMGKREVNLATLCYYALSHIFGVRSVDFHTFSSSCAETDVRVENESIIMNNPAPSSGTSFYSIVDMCVSKLGIDPRLMPSEEVNETKLPHNNLYIVISDMYAEENYSMTHTNKGLFKFIDIQGNKEGNEVYGEENVFYLDDYEI